MEPSRLLTSRRSPFGSLREFRVDAFIAVLDMLSSDIDKRAKAYSEVSDLFGLLCNLMEMEAMEPRDMR